MSRFLPILLVLLLLCPSPLLAASKTSGTKSAQATYKVRQGDTLSGIAQKSRLTVAELKRLNNLSSNKLKLGQVLKVAKSSGSTKNTKHTASAGKTQTTTASATHKVKQGDTLSGIAQKAKISVAELKRLNNLSSNNLKLGQVLVVSKSSGSTKNTKKSAGTGKASVANSTTHKVKQGDTLSEIARKAKISVAELKRLNNLSGSNLKLGQVLVVSKKGATATEKTAAVKMQTLTHKVKKGDTLFEIAQKTKISVAELRRLNKLSGDRLKLGQVLVVGSKPVPVEKTVVAKTPSMEKGAIVRELTRDIPVDANASIFEKTALSFLNTPYRFGGNGKNGIDCSAFVQKVFREFDLKLPRTAREQYTLGTRVPKGDLQLGDLIFFQTYAKYPSHVGIYLGDDKMIHASSRNRGVVVSSINSNYFRKRFIGAKRLGLSLSPEGIDLDEFSGRMQATVADEVEDGTEEGAQIGAGNG
ncbi:LysM peptidoglycan-binding domain-containing protein [Desulfuromonas acetexigens]|nr:peptidoglycan endopeptidase [Desulfuromonas acetexigens]